MVIIDLPVEAANKTIGFARISEGVVITPVERILGQQKATRDIRDRTQLGRDEGIVGRDEQGILERILFGK